MKIHKKMADTGEFHPFDSGTPGMSNDQCPSYTDLGPVTAVKLPNQKLHTDPESAPNPLKGGSDTGSATCLIEGSM